MARRGLRRSSWTKWEDNPSVINNPSFPYPRGHPILIQQGEPVPCDYRIPTVLTGIGSRVRCKSSFGVYYYGIESGMVIDTRTLFYGLKHGYRKQLMLDQRPGVWIQSSWFENEYKPYSEPLYARG